MLFFYSTTGTRKDRAMKCRWCESNALEELYPYQLCRPCFGLVLARHKPPIREKD